MRLVIALSCALLIVPASLPAQSVAVRFAFDTVRAASAEPGAVLAQRQRIRAWQDTVEVYLVQQAGASGLRLVGPEERANYLASVVAAPVSGSHTAVTIAVVVFEPGTATPWTYLTHYAACVESAREAAGALIGQTVAAVSTRRP